MRSASIHTGLLAYMSPYMCEYVVTAYIHSAIPTLSSAVYVRAFLFFYRSQLTSWSSLLNVGIVSRCLRSFLFWTSLWITLWPTNKGYAAANLLLHCHAKSVARTNRVISWFQQPNPFCPFLLQQTCSWFPFSAEQYTFSFLSELMDLFVAGREQSAANQPNNLAEGHPPL